MPDTMDHVLQRGTAERWRYACPEGHASWQALQSHAYCCGCQRRRADGADINPRYEELLDKQTGETITYSELPWGEGA
ncbi:hypothetical protein [Haloarcula amylovorans]|uniref:hypothetical protein n=1 Tax=Haloarcula amylovorans TaxID=2562280 RepID=UPI001075E5E9|nr:hypothetical protein [Halomicroarcula amylolytica]